MDSIKGAIAIEQRRREKGAKEELTVGEKYLVLKYLGGLLLAALALLVGATAFLFLQVKQTATAAAREAAESAVEDIASAKQELAAISEDVDKIRTETYQEANQVARAEGRASALVDTVAAIKKRVDVEFEEARRLAREARREAEELFDKKESIEREFQDVLEASDAAEARTLKVIETLDGQVEEIVSHLLKDPEFRQRIAASVSLFDMEVQDKLDALERELEQVRANLRSLASSLEAYVSKFSTPRTGWTVYGEPCHDSKGHGHPAMHNRNFDALLGPADKEPVVGEVVRVRNFGVVYPEGPRKDDRDKYAFFGAEQYPPETVKEGLLVPGQDVRIRKVHDIKYGQTFIQFEMVDASPWKM